MNNYPPGVTGREPHLTGEWPCPSCDGAVVERDPDGPGGVTCWYCGGTGIAPEDPPSCPQCGSTDTLFVEQLDPVTVAQITAPLPSPTDGAVHCHACGETTRP
jgi:hypothetical protein